MIYRVVIKSSHGPSVFRGFRLSHHKQAAGNSDISGAYDQYLHNRLRD